MGETVWGLVGLLGGLLLSIAWWYVLAHKFAPSVKFGEKISVCIGDKGERRYRLKILNDGRRRGIIDISLRVHLRYPGVSLYEQPMPKNLNGITIQVSTDHVLRLRPKMAEIVRLKVDETLAQEPPLVRRLYPIEGQRQNLTLEDLLERSKGAFVHARILCYDEWSGSRKYYESPRYGADDVAEGKFKGLKVVPIENGDEITGGSTKPGDVVL